MRTLFSAFIQDNLYQYVHPVVCAQTQKIVFFEVLSRVIYKEKLYPPSDFLVDITNEQRLIMTRQIIKKISTFQKQYPHYSFSINVSSIEFANGIDSMLSELERDADDNLLDPKRTIIEMIETVLVDSSVIKRMKLLKQKHGYRFAVDDFGAGYSSVSLLVQSNGLFDFVKIDGALVRDVEYDENKRYTLTQVINIIKASKKKIVLEYISTPMRLEVCRRMNADYFQGFLFGKPAPLEEYIQNITSEGILPFCHVIYDKEDLLSPLERQRACSD